MVASNSDTNGQTRALVKMMKRWQANCSVTIKSFWIELLAISFLNTWEHRGKSKLWYDFMIRDFLKYIVDRPNTYVFAPGTSESMNIGDTWLSKAKTAYAHAEKACSFEGRDAAAAGEEWQKIFGKDIPKHA
jgi:hypothetical protein